MPPPAGASIRHSPGTSIPPPASASMPPPTALADWKRAGAEWDLRVHVNFSPDKQHEAVFVEGPGPGPRGALLWVDGRPVPVPVDADGHPRSDRVKHWLDRLFSRGLLKASCDPARALTLWAWMSEAGRIATGDPHSFRCTYPPPPHNLTPADLEATGFELEELHSGRNSLDDASRSVVRVEFSPDFQHQAVLITAPEDWSGSLAWVDGQPVAVPRDDDGDPLCEHGADWIDTRFVYFRIGGLWKHPLLDAASMDPLGDLRGVLIWDAQQQVCVIELPAETQRWTTPILTAAPDEPVHIYADGAALRSQRPDRIISISR